MSWTRHGWYIHGTIVDGDKPPVKPCGGPKHCRVCDADVVAHRGISHNPGFESEEFSVFNAPHDGIDHQVKAKRAVVTYINQRTPRIDVGKFAPLTTNDVFVTWWSKTLDNWKAVVVTNVMDGMYYELTYNGAKNELYLDVYRKLENVVL